MAHQLKSAQQYIIYAPFIYSAYLRPRELENHFAALRFAAFGSTAALNPAPATNFGTLLAGILILVPLLGLNPARAARLTCLNVPKPTIPTVPPFLTVATMASVMVARMRAASAFDSSCLVAI